LRQAIRTPKIKEKPLSLSQNLVGLGKSYGENGPKPAFSVKSKVAFSKTEVLGKPPFVPQKQSCCRTWQPVVPVDFLRLMRKKFRLPGLPEQTCPANLQGRDRLSVDFWRSYA
jgi:hypothetical protein